MFPNSTNVPTPPTHLVRKMNDLSDRLYKASSESSTLHQVGNWEVKANSNAKVPELLDEQPLPNVKKYLKPQIKMGVKNVKPSDQTKKDTDTNLYSSVKQLFQCQPCCASEHQKFFYANSEDFQNHLASAHHKKVMKDLELLHDKTVDQIRIYAQWRTWRIEQSREKNTDKTSLKVPEIR